MIFSENRYPPAELGCSRVLPLSICASRKHPTCALGCSRVLPLSICASRKHPTCALGCSRVLPLSMAQVGNIRLAHSGVPEFCHCQWRKSETSDLRTRVFPSSAIVNGASRKHPISRTRVFPSSVTFIPGRKSEASDLRGQARGQDFFGFMFRRVVSVRIGAAAAQKANAQ
jgi:hypothetical protein